MRSCCPNLRLINTPARQPTKTYPRIPATVRRVRNGHFQRVGASLNGTQRRKGLGKAVRFKVGIGHIAKAKDVGIIVHEILRVDVFVDGIDGDRRRRGGNLGNVDAVHDQGKGVGKIRIGPFNVLVYIYIYIYIAAVE